MKQKNRYKKKFSRARVTMIESHLMTTEELMVFRSQIEDASAGNSFCDSCAFCCVDGVETLEIEAKRIRELVKAQPDLHQPRGYICSFLEIEPKKLNHNIATYGQLNKPVHASSCRIYQERPIICRLFPAPEAERCRKYNISKAPDMNRILQEHKTGEDFPETLLEKYYLSFRWEWMNSPTPTQWDLDYHLTPGWQCNQENVSIEKKEGPHWLRKFDILPAFFPSVTSYQLDEWELSVARFLESPVNYHQLVEHFESEIDGHSLGTLLGQLELMNIVVPVDIGRRMAIGRKRMERIIDGSQDH